MEYFESLNNPDNAELRTLIKNDDDQYSLDIPFSQWVPREVDDSVLHAPRMRF
ncbi:hypothetical protein D3C85_1870160 [compost metagenome]